MGLHASQYMQDLSVANIFFVLKNVYHFLLSKISNSHYAITAIMEEQTINGNSCTDIYGNTITAKSLRGGTYTI